MDYLFAQIELPDQLGVIDYAERLFWWGERSKMSLWNNLSLDGGWDAIATGRPLGWTLDPTSGVGGSRESSDVIWGDAYRITGDGATLIRGLISQSAATDTAGDPLCVKGVDYSVRARVKRSGGLTAGTLHINAFSPTMGLVPLLTPRPQKPCPSKLFRLYPSPPSAPGSRCSIHPTCRRACRPIAPTWNFSPAACARARASSRNSRRSRARPNELAQNLHHPEPVQRLLLLNSLGTIYKETAPGVLSLLIAGLRPTLQFTSPRISAANMALATDRRADLPRQFDDTFFRSRQPGGTGRRPSVADSALTGNISPGVHECVVVFVTRQDLDRPSPPPPGPHRPRTIAVTNIPTGPANVVQRLLTFTAEAGVNFQRARLDDD